MPKARHHGEEPPTPVANLMRQQQVILANQILLPTRQLDKPLRTVQELQQCGITREMFTLVGCLRTSMKSNAE